MRIIWHIWSVWKQKVPNKRCVCGCACTKLKNDRRTVAHYQNRPLIVLVTCATVCSPIGMSSLRRSTRLTTADGSASRIILNTNEHQLNQWLWRFNWCTLAQTTYPPSQISSKASIIISKLSKTARFSTFFFKIKLTESYKQFNTDNKINSFSCVLPMT